VNEVSRFYDAQNQLRGTHVALRWNGRMRYAVPCEPAAQKACWKIFQPGRLELPLRAMASLPRLCGAINCVESETLVSIRKTIGYEAGFSCCRTGAPGPWSKDTILLLDDRTVTPLCIVKGGAGEAVGSLLRNEANWLQSLQAQASLGEHVPRLIGYHQAADLSFVAECPLPGRRDDSFGKLHSVFLRKLQDFSRQTMRLEESRLYLNLCARLKGLNGRLSPAWSDRLDKGMRQIEKTLSGPPILLVAAHNDFTVWNIRVESGIARVFDWEYADHGQFPLFDPLHFALMPMALRNSSTIKMVQSMRNTIQLCRQWLGEESCYEGQTQALAYLMNLCTLYLSSMKGKYDFNPVLDGYANIIDHLCFSRKSVMETRHLSCILI
jgi:hypothetical protein